MRHRKLQFSFLAAAALTASAVLVACSGDQSLPTPAAESRGSVAFELQAAPGVTLGTVAYTIIGPASFSKTGSFDVSQSTKIGALIGPLPVGTGYTITLSANSVEGTSSCSGSAPFDVLAHQTTPVAIALTCHEGPRTGSVMVNGALNICPTLDAVNANPAEVLVGTSISLSASAHDSDAGPVALSYRWTAASGSLSDANTASATFTCSASGAVVLSVAASDGDPLASCADTRTITVQCSAPGAGSAGAGGASVAGSGGAVAGGAAGAPAGAGGSSGASAGSSGAGAGGSAGASAGSSGAGAGGTGGASAGAGGTGGAANAGTGGVSSGGASGSAGAAGGASDHLVIYRVGDGSGSLVNTGNPVFVDEFTTSGSPVRSIPMPLTANGNNRRLVASGTATSEGLLTRSADGHFVVLTGYDAPLPTSGLVSTTGAAVPRIVGRVAADGTIDTSTQVIDGLSGNNPRSAATTDGSQLWVTGASGGVRFLPLGNTSATTTQLSTTVTNLRQIGIFSSQLFVSDSSGAIRLGTVGSGLPTTSGQIITNIPGFPTAGSPYGFFFADLDATVPGLDVLYVADDGVGLTKYSLVANSWVAKGTVGTAADAYRGLTAIVNSATVTLYATRKGGSAAAGGGELVALVDASGYNGTFAATPTLLVTAAANTAFRGVALAPIP